MLHNSFYLSCGSMRPEPELVIHLRMLEVKKIKRRMNVINMDEDQGKAF